MTRDWYKTIIVKKQGITKNKYCTHIYWDPRCSLHSPTSTKCPSQFHFSLFTFHFSLFINTSIHYFKGSLSARFRSPSDLCQRFGLQFLPMHPRQGNHHLWHGVDLLVPGQHRIRNGGAGGGWLRATCLTAVPCESWKNNKWELLCAKRSWCQVLPTKEFRHALSQRSSCSSDERVQGSGACTPPFRQ